MKRTPFRELREDLALLSALLKLLLGLSDINFEQKTYALFFIYEGQRSIRQNVRKKMLVLIGSYLDFLKRVIDEIPDAHSIKVPTQTEYDKLAKKYPEVIKSDRAKKVQSGAVE